MASNQATRGVQPKGFGFIDKRHMIPSFSSYPMKPDVTCSDDVTELRVWSTVVLVKMNFSLDDIAKGKRGPCCCRRLRRMRGLHVDMHTHNKMIV